MKFTGYCDLVRVGGQVRLDSQDAGFREVGHKILKKSDRVRILLSFETIQKPRSYKQMGTVWLLVSILFEAMEDRKPTEEEKYNLYLDVLETYADRVPMKIGSGTRPIHMSEAMTTEASKVIEGLIIELSNFGIKEDLQADVKKIILAWHAWRGEQQVDPLDVVTASSLEFRRRNPVCMACLIGGEGLQIAHIVSRGANGAIRDEPWNWLILCQSHHGKQHHYGWASFLEKYPHLKGRWERAQKLSEECEGKISDRH